MLKNKSKDIREKIEKIIFNNVDFNEIVISLNNQKSSDEIISLVSKELLKRLPREWKLRANDSQWNMVATSRNNVLSEVKKIIKDLGTKAL